MRPSGTFSRGATPAVPANSILCVVVTFAKLVNGTGVVPDLKCFAECAVPFAPQKLLRLLKGRRNYWSYFVTSGVIL